MEKKLRNAKEIRLQDAPILPCGADLLPVMISSQCRDDCLDSVGWVACGAAASITALYAFQRESAFIRV